eukprot:TRINITY_DN2130_c0_g1_i3.p1 TRINITY_DN2130_c0_g1~~TRINITY_DN2130_c0_g1_i3.p1  ORF type:complete len:103 (+),score=9.71 TRINITY_DN2130_c0_g1_i3:20-328(+)
MEEVRQQSLCHQGREGFRVGGAMVVGEKGVTCWILTHRQIRGWCEVGDGAAYGQHLCRPSRRLTSLLAAGDMSTLHTLHIPGGRGQVSRNGRVYVEIIHNDL